MSSSPHISQPFVLAFTMCGVTVYVCVCARVRYPHCPLLVGDHFATVAVGDQMANWALCHVTSLHWGPSQSAQARLLNCRRPHRHHSPILTESSLRAPEGPFQRLTERALLQLIRHQATGLFTFSQPEWLNLCVCVRETHFPAVCWLNPVRFHVFMMLLLADTFSVLDSKLDYRCCELNWPRLCHHYVTVQAPDWLCILGITSKTYCTRYKRLHA